MQTGSSASEIGIRCICAIHPKQVLACTHCMRVKCWIIGGDPPDGIHRMGSIGGESSDGIHRMGSIGGEPSDGIHRMGSIGGEPSDGIHQLGLNPRIPDRVIHHSPRPKVFCVAARKVTAAAETAVMIERHADLMDRIQQDRLDPC